MDDEQEKLMREANRNLTIAIVLAVISLVMAVASVILRAMGD